MAKKKMDSQYDASSIDVKEGLEAVRARFDMYAGAKDEAAFHCVKEIVDNSIDEVLNGYADKVEVALDPDLSVISITDNGRGIPVDMHPKFKVPAIELIFMKLHAGGKFDKNSFKVSGGKNGVGSSVVNALSDFLIVEVKRNGEVHRIEFSKGKVTKPLKVVGKCKKDETGTKVTFKPDIEILEEFAVLNENQIKENLNLRAYINKGVNILFTNLKTKDVTPYYYENGISDLLDTMNNKPITKKLSLDFSEGENEYNLVMNWDGSVLGETIRSFVNGIAITKGTNETALRTALTNSFTDYMNAEKKIPKGVEIKGEDIREGLNAIMVIKHKLPEFKGQTKDELSNRDVIQPIVKNVYTLITEYLEDSENKNEVEFLIKRTIEFSKKRKEALNLKQKVINIVGGGGLSFMETFQDCTSKNPEECEIFICEGKSAGGSLKEGRIARIQAVFPLRGKCKNTYKSATSVLINNNEFNELIKVLFGTNDIKKIKENWRELLRYHKIIITTDADDDGYHIASLLLTFFYDHFKELIEEGFVYIAVSPLYRVQIKKDVFKYFNNDYEFNKYLNQQLSKTYKVIEGESLSKIIDKKELFTENFDNFTKKYNMHKDIADNFILEYVDGNSSLEDVFQELIENYGMEITELEENEYMVEGFYGVEYHNFIVDDSFIKNVKNISKIFNNYIVTYSKKDNIFEDQTISDFIAELNAHTIERNRLKGLGESDADELFDTTMDPEKRELIKVELSDNMEEMEDNIQKILFGPNADLRKDFINENL